MNSHIGGPPVQLYQLTVLVLLIVNVNAFFFTWKRFYVYVRVLVFIACLSLKKVLFFPFWGARLVIPELVRSHRWLTCLSSAVMVCSVMLGSAFWKGRMAPGHRLDLMTETKISEACLHRYKPTRLTTVSFVLICMYSVKNCFYVYMYTHLKWIEYHNHISLLNSYNSLFF